MIRGLVLPEWLPQSHPSERRFPWLLAGVLLAGLLVTVGLQPAVIVADSAEVSMHRVQIVPPVAGLVTAVAVAPGDTVKVGQAIARIDDAEARIHVQQAAARRVIAQGNGIAVAEADLALARLQLAQHVLRAPSAGTVASLALEPGDYAAAGTPIATLVAAEAPWITAEVNERDATAVHVGAKAAVMLPAYPGRTWQGRVSEIGRLAQKKKKKDTQAGSTLPVRITLEGLPSSVMPEMSATVSIER